MKAIKDKPLGGLDLNIADEDEFSPDKLRANIERLYMTVIIGVMGFGKHIARLRSWREPRRTAAFCTVCTFVPKHTAVFAMANARLARHTFWPGSSISQFLWSLQPLSLLSCILPAAVSYFLLRPWRWSVHPMAESSLLRQGCSEATTA